MKNTKILHIRLFLYILISLFAVFLPGCTAGNTEPLTFRPELFTKPDPANDTKECVLAVGNVDVTFSEASSNDAKIRISGMMNKYCSNLQVSMNEPDMGKNINIEIGASTSTASGGTDRPFEVELQATSLRYGSYTIWINNEAMKIFTIQ